MAGINERYEKWKKEKGGKSTVEQRYKAWKAKNTDLEGLGKEIASRTETWLKNHNQYVSNYNARYYGRKGNYEDSYVGDSGKWLDTVTAQKTNFDKERDNLLQILDFYGDFYDANWVSSVREALTGASKQQEQILKAASGDADFFGQFTDADQYGQWQTQEGYRNKYSGQSYEDIVAAMEGLEAGQERDWLGNYQYEALQKSEDFDRQSRYANEEKGIGKYFSDPTYEFINGRLNHALYDALAGVGADFKYDKMTEDEVAIYNYFYAKEGKEKADAYLKSLNEKLVSREKQEIQKDFSKFSKENPVLASVASVPLSLLSGYEFSENALKYIAEKAVMKDATIDPNYTAQASGVIRGTVAEQVDWQIGNWDAFDFVYNTAMSGADSLVGGLAFGNLGGAVLGLSAAAQATNDALERGMSDGQAFWNGLMSGVFEGLFETVSIGNFNRLKEVAPEKVKDIIKNLGKSMLVNASEEALTELANITYDTLINGEFANYTWEELKNGAWQKALGQVIEAGASGALMGLGMGGVGNAMGYSKGVSQAKQNFAGRENQLVEGALQADPDNTFAQKMQQRIESNKKLSGGQLLKLSGQVKASDMASMEQAAAQRLKELGATENVEAAAKAIAKQAAGQELSRNEARLAKQYDVVAGELEGRFDAEWTGRIGTKVINAQEYSRLIKMTEAEQASAQRADATVSQVEAQTQENEYDGVAKQKSTGQSMVLGNVASVEGGKVMVQTDKGQIPLSDVTFEDADTEMLWRSALSAKGITAEGANGIIKAYDGKVPVATYLHGALAEYRNGLNNIASGDGMASKLTKVQREVIYSLAQKARQEKANEAKKIAATSSKPRNNSKGAESQNGVHFDRKGRSFDEVRETALKTMEQLHKILGVEFTVFESFEKDGKRYWVDENGNQMPAPNGFYKDGMIYIDLNAGNTGKGTMLFTVAHELTHYIKQWSPEKFQVLSDFLLEQYGKKDISVNELVDRQTVKAEMAGRKLSWDEALEEVVADSMETMLTDGNAMQMMQQLKQKDKTLWERIADWFREFAEDLKKLVEAYKGVDPDSREGKMVADMQDVIGTLEQLYAEALVEAGDNAAWAEKNTTPEGDVKMSVRTVAGDAVVWIEDSGFTNAQLKDPSVIAQYIANHIGEVYRIIESGQKVYIGKDLPAEYTHSKYTSYLQKNKQATLRAKNKAATALGEMIEIATNRRWEATKHKATKDAKYGMYRYDTKFAFPVKDQSGKVTTVKAYDAELLIRNASDGKKYLYDIVNIKEDTANALDLRHKEARKGSYQAATQSGVGKDNVAQDADDVKEKFSLRDSDGNELSQEQQEYFKDSKVRDEQGRLLAMYHGTPNGGFTKFRSGTYFTQNPGYADVYQNPGASSISAKKGAEAPMTYKVYLDIKKPFDTRNAKERRIFQQEFYRQYGTGTPLADSGLPDWVDGMDLQEFIEEMEYDYDGLILDEGGVGGYGDEVVSRGLSYVVFSSEQVKDVDNRKPTSDPDIRYSGRDGNATYAEIEEERQKLFQRERDLNERKREAENNPELLQAMDDFSSLFTEMKQLLPKRRDGTATQAELDRIEEIKTLREERLQRVSDLQESIGLNAMTKEAEEIRAAKEALRVASDEAWAREGAEKENKAIEKAGVPAAEYFRKKALKAFKTTTNFNEAGYLLPDGKLLNFSGGERNHRYRDHREIGEIYEATQGVAALNRFLSDGNIRIMAESPGIDLAVGVEPTKEQYAALRRFINTNGVNDGQFFVDFSNTDGSRAGNYSYQGRVFADRIINDIKYFYENGSVREQSSVASFLSDRDPELEKVNRVLEKENEGLKEDVSRLKDLLKLQRQVTGGAKITDTAVDAMAKQLMRYAGATGDRTELAKLLGDFYSEVKSRTNVDLESIKKAAQPAAKWLADHGKTKNDAYRLLREAGILRQVYDSYWRVSTLYSADEATQKQIGKLTRNHFDSMAEMRKTLTTQTARLEMEQKQLLRDVRSERREALDKQYKEISSKYQQSREKNVEGRKKTEMRRKIRRTIMDLNKLFTHGTKERNVKEGMKDFVAQALASAEVLFMDNYSNEDMVRYGVEVQLTAEENRLLDQTQSLLRQRDDLYSLGAIGTEGEDVIAGDTSAFDERMKKSDKLDRQIAKNMTLLKSVFERERARLNEATVSKVLDDLAKAYKDLGDADETYIRFTTDETVYQFLQQMSKEMQGATVKDMRLDQLEDLHKAYKMVLTTVRNANRMFAQNLSKTREELGKQTITEVKLAGGNHGLWLPGEDKANAFLWNNLKPVYAFERIGSETLKELFDNIRAGEDSWAVDMNDARAFYLEQAKKHGYGGWDMEKQHKFSSSSGVEFSLNLEQIMSLYAYSKREQAHDHLLKGGFVFDGNTEVQVNKHGIKMTYLNKTAKAHNVSLEILADIVSTLTPEQKAFVDAMQEYLSATMGGKGNQVSMELYGVKLFNEQYYFPLRSAGQYMERAKEADMKKQQGQISIVNSGFAKATTPKSSNPVVLSGFMDVWADHVNEMSMYHSFVLPMEDFRRVYNYATPNTETGQSASVNAALQDAYGDAATKYIDQLYKDLNGGALSDPRENLAKRLTGQFKKAAVFASLSVVVQQPSAIGRAFALIDPRHFIGSKVDSQRHKALWAQLKRYAPVAAIKEMGYFDTGMGKSVRDYIKGKEYGTLKEKAAALFKDGNYRDEVLSKAPALADELTWCAIWEAVKRETKEKNPGMGVSSEEFLQMAGKRFTEVVTKTQVYDSVLARSSNMRSKGAFMSMWTAFMAEPTTTINMVEDALRKGRKGDRKYAARAMGAVLTSVMVNSVLSSLVYAMRDDDEDETFLEKYTQSLLTEMLDGINPITYYPFLKDVWSSLQGFDIERADMSLITKAVEALTKLVKVYGKDEGSRKEGELSKAWWGVVDYMTAFMGVPVKNIRREINGVIGTVKTIYKDVTQRDTSWGSLVDKAWDAVKNNIPVVGWLPDETAADKLYDATVRGDRAYLQRLESAYSTQSKLDSAIRKGLRDNDSRIWEAAMCWNRNDLEGYKRIAREIVGEGHFSQDNVVMAIQAEAKSMLDATASEAESKSRGYFTAEKFAVAIAQGNGAMADTIQADMIATAQANGDTAEAARKSFASSAKSALKKLFIAGGMTPEKAMDAMVSYCDMDEEDAQDALLYWDFLSQYPQYEDLSQSAVLKYYEYVAPAGIDTAVYYEYCKQASLCESDKDADGETISGSRKAKILAVIDAMDLTKKQKNALYYANGWSKSELWKAPWN